MSKNFIFSSESVGEGHPDKVSDYISDSVLDACLEQDPMSRVACETLVKSNCVIIAGEITTNAKLNYEEIVRGAIRNIGYVNDDDIFHAEKVFISNILISVNDIPTKRNLCSAISNPISIFVSATSVKYKSKRYSLSKSISSLSKYFFSS